MNALRSLSGSASRTAPFDCYIVCPSLHQPDSGIEEVSSLVGSLRFPAFRMSKDSVHSQHFAGARRRQHHELESQLGQGVAVDSRTCTRALGTWLYGSALWWFGRRSTLGRLLSRLRPAGL